MRPAETATGASAYAGPVAEVPLDMPRIWVEFPDPEDAGQRFRCDLTWLTSSWMCIYGNGCQGIYADRPDDGCCTLGAHFTEDDDYERVAAVAADLGPDEWQYRDVAYRKGVLRKDSWTEQEDGATKTKVVDGACIFLNRPGFPSGMGCALHQHAVLQGLPPTSLKPEVCWQLPIRRSYRTVELADADQLPRGVDHRVRPPRLGSRWPRPRLVLLGEPRGARRPGTGLPLQQGRARRADGRDARTRSWCVRCEAHLRAVTAARRIGNRKLLPLLVHPATLAAQDVRSAERESAAKVEKLAAAVKSSGKRGRKRSHR